MTLISVFARSMCITIKTFESPNFSQGAPGSMIFYDSSNTYYFGCGTWASFYLMTLSNPGSFITIIGH